MDLFYDLLNVAVVVGGGGIGGEDKETEMVMYRKFSAIRISP